jgi:hypothetical protein
MSRESEPMASSKLFHPDDRYLALMVHDSSSRNQLSTSRNQRGTLRLRCVLVQYSEDPRGEPLPKARHSSRSAIAAETLMNNASSTALSILESSNFSFDRPL